MFIDKNCIVPIPWKTKCDKPLDIFSFLIFSLSRPVRSDVAKTSGFGKRGGGVTSSKFTNLHTYIVNLPISESGKDEISVNGKKRIVGRVFTFNLLSLPTGVPFIRFSEWYVIIGGDHPPPCPPSPHPWQFGNPMSLGKSGPQSWALHHKIPRFPPEFLPPGFLPPICYHPDFYHPRIFLPRTFTRHGF